MNSKSLFDMTEEAKQLVKNELPAAYLLMGAPDEAALLKISPPQVPQSEAPVGAIFQYRLPEKRGVPNMAVCCSAHIYTKRE